VVKGRAASGRDEIDTPSSRNGTNDAVRYTHTASTTTTALVLLLLMMIIMSKGARIQKEAIHTS
jgi:hypothetical protein